MKSTVLILWLVAISAGCRRLDVDHSGSVPVVESLLPPKVTSRLRSNVPVDTIVLHFCSDALENPRSPFNMERIRQIYIRGGVSAHYVIDRDGVVFRWVPETRTAFHAGEGKMPWGPVRENSLNEFSIGVELLGVGTREEMARFIPVSVYDKIPREHIGFTPAQYVSLKKLLEDISARWPNVSTENT